jgi:hypothetical protein
MIKFQSSGQTINQTYLFEALLKIHWRNFPNIFYA